MSIIEKFQLSVADHADKIALLAGDEKVSYRQLNDQSLTLLQALKGEPGKEMPGNIALLLGNGKDVIVALLAVLQTGRAYVPLDNIYPVQRLAYMLGDCGAGLLLTNTENLELAYKVVHACGLSIQLLNIDNLPTAVADIPAMSPPTKQDDAIILYTSGSTGTPKRVTIAQESVVSFCDYFQAQLHIGTNDKLMLTTSCSHAVSVLDIFSCLFSGATIVLYDVRKNFRREDFVASVQFIGITILHTVPAFFRYITEAVPGNDSFASVRLLLLGGDGVHLKDLRIFKKWFAASAYIVNLYGQTELLLATMNILDHRAVEEGTQLPIGYPIDLVEGSVTGEDGKELPVMSNGELVFTIKATDTVIKTGDIGRWLPDGTLEYTGRKDYQYKINGNRVHAAEIERAIDGIPGIGKCIVMMAGEDEDKQLTAYYTSDASCHITPLLIKENIRYALAEHSIPQVFVALDEFPQLPNGKINREALLSMKQLREDGQKETVPTEIISQLITIWERVLQTENVEEDDNFFLLGGNSLHATEMISHIYLAFHIELESSIIFDNQTIAELSRIVMRGVQEPTNLYNNN